MADRSKPPCLSVLIIPTATITVSLVVLEAVEVRLALEGDITQLKTAIRTRESSRTTRTSSPRATVMYRHLRASTREEAEAGAVVAFGDKIEALGTGVVEDPVGGAQLL